MRALFQAEWQGIPFSSFAEIEISSKNLPGPEFYDAFYRALFQKYGSYETLDADWRRKKDEVMDWLVKTVRDGARVLSMGCGLGYVEQRLYREHGDRIEIHVQDYACQALRWLRQVMPAESIHDGGGELAKTECYDLIYLCAVDYALSHVDLVDLLSGVKSNLREQGEVLMISASFLDNGMGQVLLRPLKDAVKLLLERLGLYKRGQFWGWLRTREEYRAIMQGAGFATITDGFIETSHQRTYWIKGSGV